LEVLEKIKAEETTSKRLSRFFFRNFLCGGKASDVVVSNTNKPTIISVSEPPPSNLEQAINLSTTEMKPAIKYDIPIQSNDNNISRSNDIMQFEKIDQFVECVAEHGQCFLAAASSGAEATSNLASVVLSDVSRHCELTVPRKWEQIVECREDLGDPVIGVDLESIFCSPGAQLSVGAVQGDVCSFQPSWLSLNREVFDDQSGLSCTMDVECIDKSYIECKNECTEPRKLSSERSSTKEVNTKSGILQSVYGLFFGRYSYFGRREGWLNDEIGPSLPTPHNVVLPRVDLQDTENGMFTM
jgi:hypothetical protein